MNLQADAGKSCRAGAASRMALLVGQLWNAAMGSFGSAVTGRRRQEESFANLVEPVRKFVCEA